MLVRGSVVAMAIAITVSMAGCPSVVSPGAVLSGVWKVTPANAGNVDQWDFTATFANSGHLERLSATSPSGVVLNLDLKNTRTKVEQNQVTIRIPTLAATTIFEGTLSDDENTLAGSLSESIKFLSSDASLPAGDLTFVRE
jgi:hypothetical protein